jgi:hypothetical protein
LSTARTRPCRRAIAGTPDVETAMVGCRRLEKGFCRRPDGFLDSFDPGRIDEVGLDAEAGEFVLHDRADAL